MSVTVWFLFSRMQMKSPPALSFTHILEQGFDSCNLTWLLNKEIVWCRCDRVIRERQNSGLLSCSHFERSLVQRSARFKHDKLMTLRIALKTEQSTTNGTWKQSWRKKNDGSYEIGEEQAAKVAKKRTSIHGNCWEKLWIDCWEQSVHLEPFSSSQRLLHKLACYRKGVG